MNRRDRRALKEFDDKIGRAERVLDDLFVYVNAFTNNSGFDFEPDSVRFFLDGLDVPDDTPFEDKPKRTIESLMKRLDAIDAIGKDNDLFTERCLDYYGIKEPTEEEIECAESELRDRLNENERPKSGAMVDSRGVITRIRKNLSVYPKLLDIWDVVEEEASKGGSEVCVNKSQMAVIVRDDYNRCEERANVTAVHEVLGHIYRWSSGLGQEPLSNTYFCGAGRKWMTEEGVANWVSDQLCDRSREPPFYPAYFIAGAERLKGAKKSEIEEKMLEYGMEKEDAEKVARRVSRGLKDPEKEGCCPKDIIYFRGKRAIQEYLDSGGSLRNLYVGAVALEEMEQVERFLREGILRPAKYVPDIVVQDR